MKQHTYMDKSEVAKNVMKNAVNMVLQDALDILEADDGRSFEEKRDAVIKRLTLKADTELSRLPVELFTPLIKTVGIALLSRTGSDLCRDAGEGAIASVLETAGAVAAIAVSLPLFRAAWELLRSLL